MLDVKVKSEISGSTFWKSENDFEPYIYGIYAQIRTHTNNSMILAEDRSECWKAGYNYRFSSYWPQEITPGQTVDWTSYYGTIGHCNLLIYQIDRFQFTNEALRKQILAEAHALRAHMYFLMAKIWGDVPLVLEPVFTEKEPLYPRAPADEVFRQINSDIEMSLGLLSDLAIKDKYRFSRPSILALYADVKIWQASVLNGGERDFQIAIDAISEIERSGIELLENYGEIFDVAKNKEIILSIYLDRSEYVSGKYNEALLRFDTSGGADNVAELPIALAGQQGYCLSNEALALFEIFPEDKRINRTYIPEIIRGEIQNYWPNKFRGTQYTDTREADSDFIIYRLSDMYLLKAEAYASVGQTDKSLEYLNKVRTRAGIPLYSETNTITLKQEILRERGRELFHELKRWWDLVRAHKTGTIDVYQFVPNLRNKTTPIYWAVHTNLMIKNELLVQNPGYEN
jgi:hypothetical protein